MAEVCERAALEALAMTLERIICHGNRTLDLALLKAGWRKQTPNKITCADGFTLSVIAGGGTYCTPKPEFMGFDGDVPEDYMGPYTHVEVGYPSGPVPDEWDEFSDGGSIYGYVPVELVRSLVEKHGGES